MFRNWFATTRRKKPAPSADRYRSNFRRLSRHFEQLEDRYLLAAVTWSLGATGNWDVAANWSGSAVPTSTADVTISTANPATITVQAGDVESIHSLTLGANDTLLITGGALTTAAGLTNGGSITVSPGRTLSVGGAYVQSVGATLSMPGGVLGTDPATNMTGNTDFELPVAKNNTTTPSSWSTWGTAFLSTQYAFTGSQSLVISGSNSGIVASFSVTAGNSYTASTYAMTPAANPLTGSANAQLQLLFFNSSGNQISAYSAPNSVVILTSASGTGGPLTGSVGNQGWNHFFTTAIAPPNATSAKVQLTTQVGIGASGGAVYWDDIKAGPSAGGLSKLAAASVSNSGTMTVGLTNAIVTSGTFTQTSTGVLDVQIGGAPGSSNYGLVNVGGAATLGGTLKTDIVNGYVPTTSDSFMPVEFASETGNFASYSLPSGANYQFQGAATFTNVVVSAVPTAPLAVSVDASTTLHSATTNLLGINLTSWDSALPTAQTQQLVGAAGLDLFRFPGGAISDTYHFNAPTNPSSVDNFVQFVQFVIGASGTGMVTIDYGSGSPQEAAAELAYLEGSTTDTTPLGTGIEWNTSANQWQSVNWGTVSTWASVRGASPLATDDGLNFMRIAHPAPITNVQYWEVGNEIYGSWETDHHGTAGPGGVSTGAQHDPSTYVAFAQQFATLATEIVHTAGLPSISIGIDSGDPTGASDAFWTKNVLTDGRLIGFVPGFISDHIYMQQPGSESDSGLLNGTVSSAGNILDWTTRYNAYEALLAATVPNNAASVLVMATETNSVAYNPGKQTTSLVNGLATANSIGSLLESGYSGALDWDLRNSWQTDDNNSNLLYGWREAGDYGLLGDPGVNTAPSTGANIPYPAYFAMQLASKLITSGGQVVSVSSNYGELDAYAVLQSSGDLTLLVINTNPAANLTEQFNLAGFQPSGSAVVWQYGETQDTAQSKSTTGSATLSQSNAQLNVNGASFSYSFPAYSMTVLDLQAAPSGPVVKLGGAGGNFAATFIPGGGAVSIVGASSLSLVDPGSANLAGATVTIGNLPDGAAESLAVAGVGANNMINGTNIIAVYASGVLTLSGSDTLANYQQVLRTLVYNDTSASPNLATRLVSVAITDGVQSSAAVTSSVAIAPQADLQITISDGQTTTIPGSAVSYTIVVSNAGPSNVSGASITDALPATLSGATYTATASGGATSFTASGSGAIGDTVTLPSGSTITYIVAATLSASASGTLVSAANVAAPSGTTDPAAGNNSATDTDTLAPQADLQISSTDGQTTQVPGTAVTYTIVVTNVGPSSVTGAKVTDALPATLAAATYTATGAGGATGFALAGNGSISDTVNMPVGSSITYVLQATVASAAGGTLANTSSVAVPTGTTDTNPTNNSATDTDTLTPQADLQITNTDSQTMLVPGAAVTYTIVVTNAGPSSVSGATVADTLPDTLVGATYTATGGATGFTPGGSGAIDDTVTLPSGSSITYIVQATASATASGTLATMSSVAVPTGTTETNPDNNSATDTDTLTPQADLQITNTDAQTMLVPGAAVTYTIVVTNAGPSSVSGATVADTLPDTLAGVTYTATAAGGATGFTTGGSGAIDDTVNLPSGSSITYIVQATASAAASGTLTTTASVAVPSGTLDTNPDNNSATDTDTITGPDSLADLQVTIADGQTTLVPSGAAVTYTIVVSNVGINSVAGASVADSLPATLTAVTYTATSAGGATGFTAGGSGNINDTVNLPLGSSITYVLHGTVSAAATGTLANSASVGVPAGTTDTDPANNSATDTDTLAPHADLQITNTDGQTALVPGAAVTYTIVVSNIGPSNVTGATVTDTLPATLASVTYTATAAGGATGFVASGSGNINNTVNLPLGSSITYVLHGTVSAAATGTLANSASVGVPAGTTDTDPANNSATDTDTLAPHADLQITNTDGQTALVPGAAVTYTIVVSNVGPSNVTGATVTDTLPATLASVTYTATAAGGATGFVASGSGNIGNTVSLPSGSSITYVLKAIVSSSATGTLANSASVAVPAGVTDPNSANNSATDTDTLAGTQADLKITDTDGQTAAVPGTMITYTIVVSNAGPSTANGVVITDTLPASATWTATATGNAGGFWGSAFGSINNTVSLPSGSTITYVAHTLLSLSATGTLTNTANVSVPAGIADPNLGNNSATDADTVSAPPANPQVDLKVTNTDGQTAAVPGTAATYTIVVSNAGPNTVTGAVITDTLPATLTGATWTATATGDAAGFWGSASGNINNTVTMPPGSTITYVVHATVSPTATGSLADTATVAVPTGTTDTNTANNTATDTDSAVVAISSTTPANGAVGVSKSTTVTVTFAAAMNASTITASTFLLLNASGQQVAGTVTYNAATKTATFTLSAALSASSSYSVRIVGGSSGVKDQNGNALTANFTWSFQTGTT